MANDKTTKERILEAAEENDRSIHDVARFEEHITNARKEEECLQFDLYTIDGQDDTLAVYEHWRKESDVWDIHFKQP
jgi:quinol monooxygenase YgiN